MNDFYFVFKIFLSLTNFKDKSPIYHVLTKFYITEFLPIYHFFPNSLYITPITKEYSKYLNSQHLNTILSNNPLHLFGLYLFYYDLLFHPNLGLRTLIISITLQLQK